MNEDLSAEIRHLSERYEEAPGSRLFAPLADAYRKSGEIDRAIGLCEEGLEKFPEYASAHVILGKCFYDKGATERSKAEFERVLEIDSENMVALKFLGDILLAEDRFDEAKSFFERLLAIDPTNESVIGTMKSMEKEFHVREIDLENDRAVRRVQQPREMATMTLAGIYASQGYYDKALKMYREILETEPGNVEASRMIDKLGTMIDSSEKQREDAFDDEVLTISVDEVGRDLVESSSGGGTSSAGPERREEAAVDDEVPPVDERDDEKEAPDAASPDRGGDGGGRDDSGAGDGKTPEGMDHFQQWLRKMKGSEDEGPEAEA